MTMFDEPINRRGTHCYKWDMLEKVCGVNPDEGIAMGVAD
jgi:cystathionine beta-lyase